MNTGLHYELANNAVYQEMCFQEANKLNFGHLAKTFIIPTNKKHTNTSAGITKNLFIPVVYMIIKPWNVFLLFIYMLAVL